MTSSQGSVASELRSLRLGLLLSLLGVLFGFAMGAAFGAVEAELKEGQRADAEAVLATVYQGDAAKMKEVLDKSWVYYQRAHLHGGGMGTAALAVILALSLVRGAPRTLRKLAALGLGIGALGYPLYWLLAGMRAPALGSTGAAKASLEWLAIPTSGLALIGLVLALACCARGLFVATARD